MERITTDAIICGKCTSCNEMVSQRVEADQTPDNLEDFLKSHHPDNGCSKPDFPDARCEPADI